MIKTTQALLNESDFYQIPALRKKEKVYLCCSVSIFIDSIIAGSFKSGYQQQKDYENYKK